MDIQVIENKVAISILMSIINIQYRPPTNIPGLQQQITEKRTYNGTICCKYSVDFYIAPIYWHDAVTYYNKSLNQYSTLTMATNGGCNGFSKCMNTWLRKQQQPKDDIYSKEDYTSCTSRIGRSIGIRTKSKGRSSSTHSSVKMI